MKNRENWAPSKYVYRKGKLVAARNTREVGAGSRLIADLIAELYEKNLKEFAKGRLLDLGCGKAPLFLAYRDFVTDNTCVDWGNTQHRNEYLDIECDLAEKLPFSDGEFDTIILSDVLEHIAQPERLWHEMCRVLATGGRIIMNAPFYYWLHEQPHDYYRYTEFALKRFVEGSGLNLLQIESIGGVPEIVADILSKCALRLPKIGRPMALFVQWVTAIVIKTGIGAKVSEATKDTFPLGYFLVAEKPGRTASE